MAATYPKFVHTRIQQMTEWSELSEEELLERYDALYAVTRGKNRARLTIRALVAQLEEEIELPKQSGEEKSGSDLEIDDSGEETSDVESDEDPEDEESDADEDPEDDEDETDVYKEAIKSYIGDIRTILKHIEEFLE